MLFGLLLGALLAAGRISRFRLLRWATAFYANVWVNTPLLVQLFWIHFALPYLTGVSTTASESGIITISLQAGAYMSGVISAGLVAVPKGQGEASDALGLSSWHRWGDIILPQALRIMVPPLANLVIAYFKLSAILSILAVPELMTTSLQIANLSYKPVEVLTASAGVYLLVAWGLSRIAQKLELALRNPAR
jgi:polar amino acid transport system permease protein